MIKKYFLSLLCLVIVSGTYLTAQDAPHSIGPAPYVYNEEEPSVVFGDLAATSRVFSINATSISASQWRKYFAGTPGTSTVVGPVHPNFFGSGDQCGPSGSQVIYVIQQISPYVLYSTDTTTGAVTNLGAITGINPGHSSGGITSLAWDATTNTAYVVSTNITQSQLYTLNLTTRVATPVGGLITNAPGIIALGCNPAGSLFAIDLVNDNLWRLNKTTGAATLVGALGYNANYGQDADFDPRDGIFYWAAIGTGVAQLRTIDTATGTSALVGNLTGFGQGLATIVPAPAGGPQPQVCNYYSSLWCPAGTLPNLPAGVYFQASAWLGDTLYVHCPSVTGAGATTIRRYTYGGSWTLGVPMPVTKTGGSLTACNGKLYYIGGGSSSILTGTNTVHEYNPATGTWTTKANMPMSLAAHGAANWGDSVIFVWGGPYTGSATNLAVHYYRVGSNTWGTISNSLPSGQGRRTFASGISGNKLIMSCGYNTTYLKSTYVGTIGANASQVTWTMAPDCPTTFAGLSRPGGASYGHYFYMISGEQAGGGYHTTAYVFRFASNTWHPTLITGKPTGMSNIFNGCVAKCINDTVKVFVPGGYSGSASPNFEMIGCGPTIVGNSQIISTTPTSYSLSQNYPNPFNPSTKISFSLPKNSDVKLVVYDILGKEVTTLVNDYRTAGTHQVEFNASNLASGVYLYRIEAGDFKDVKRMMLVK